VQIARWMTCFDLEWNDRMEPNSSLDKGAFQYHNRYIKNTLSTTTAAKLLGVTVKMVQR
jgi:hypothetical protein